jgi:hypothetical protein
MSEFLQLFGTVSLVVTFLVVMIVKISFDKPTMVLKKNSHFLVKTNQIPSMINVGKDKIWHWKSPNPNDLEQPDILIRENDF